MSEVIEKQKKSKLWIIILAAVLIVAVVIIAIALSSKGSTSKKISGLISDGEKYLSEMNYEQAIAAFEEVLKIDPNNKEAYEGLAKVYIAMAERDVAASNIESAVENYRKAKTALENGMKNAGLDDVQERIDDIVGKITEIEEEEKKKTEPEETVEESPEPTEGEEETAETGTSIEEVIENPFGDEEYQYFKSYFSNATYYDAYNSAANIEIGGQDYEYTDNGWETFVQLVNDWGIYNKIAGVTGFEPYDELVLMSFGDEHFYSNRAKIAVNGDVTVIIGYGDLDWGTGDVRYVHSGDYYQGLIIIHIGDAEYYFSMEHGA